ncbi:MAG: flavodoxin domain-containing protein [Candidatus Aminicenantes bacterium]|nr:flavodoxin domain-containing protein [Candidatus Aminicenantes bacterium]
MTKILVTYLSQTGNTKKIAEAIFEGLEGDKTIKLIDEVQEIEDYSLIFIGFPVHSHSVPYKIESFLQKIPQGKKIALFSTHGSLPGGHLATEALEHAAVIASKAKVLGTFSCRGKVSMDTLEILSKSPEHKAWAEMAPSSQTHPDEGDLEDAKSFAKWVMTLSSQD